MIIYIPPCPGKIPPESFTSADLLMNDSIKSPNTEIIDI